MKKSMRKYTKVALGSGFCFIVGFGGSVKALTQAALLPTGKQAIADSLKSTSIVNIPKNKSCLSTVQAQACLPLKNPVYANQAPFLESLKIGMDLSSVQKVGVKWKTTPNKADGNILENLLFRVFAKYDEESPELVVTANDRRKDYASNSKFEVAQGMAFFTVNEQVQKSMQKAGIYYLNPSFFSNSVGKLQVNAMDGSSPENSWYNPYDGSLNLGYSLSQDEKSGATTNFEQALSGDIIAHELGHANYHHSQGGDLSYRDHIENNNYRRIAFHCTSKAFQVDSEKFCLPPARIDRLVIFDGSDSAAFVNSDEYILFPFDLCNAGGCSMGLDEGQADIHALLQYEDLNSTVLGEAMTNDLREGLDKGAHIPRNPLMTRKWVINDFYYRSGKMLLSSLKGYLAWMNSRQGPTQGSSLPAFDNPAEATNLDFDPELLIVNYQKSSPNAKQYKIKFGELNAMSDSDPRKIKIYQDFGGESHDMGALYSSILWQIRNESGMSRKEFATVFMNHLPLITSLSNLESAMNSFININKVRYPMGKKGASLGKNEQKIREILRGRGLNF